MTDITIHAYLMVEINSDVAHSMLCYGYNVLRKTMYTAIVNVIGIDGLVDALKLNVTVSELGF